MSSNSKYYPDRNHMVWLDFDPTKGKEIGKYRPALVLSSLSYNLKTGLLICCPISTSVRGASTEVFVDNLEVPSVVATTIVQTLSWKDRKVKFIAEAKSGIIQEVLLKLIPLLGIDEILKDYL
ncbi:MAG: type II toxin-antitoxin system PemK/MazF family toxin [Gammaproteobacteria bacterium]